jgi:glycosyltransferase involved in cell wall biosynthesis
VKVLHVISSGGMYGAEAVILNLSHTLRSRGHDSALGIFENSAQPNLQLYEAAQHAGVEAHGIVCKGQFDRSVPAKIKALVQATGADVMHAHGYKADVYCYMAARGGRGATVSTCHTWYDNSLALRLYGWLDRLVLRSFTGVVAVSEEVRERLRKAGVKAERIRLIRNGVPVSEVQPHRLLGSTSNPTVGLVGRLSREKGIDILIRASAQVLSQLPNVRFQIAGEGPDRAVLEESIQALHLEGSVTLLGRQEDMASFYHSLDLLVSSSRQEGLPVALLEGMAAGLPIVGTMAGEVPSIIEEGVTGTLVSIGDEQALAAAILDLLGDPERLQRYGNAAYQRLLTHYSADRMADDYLALYQDAMQAAPMGRRP